MSENVALVESILPKEADLVQVVNGADPVETFTGGNTERIAPDLEVLFAPSQTGGPGLAFEGIEGLIEGWRDWLSPWHTYLFRVEQIIDAGDHVVVHVHISGRTERHGVDIQHSPSSVWTVKDGMLVAVRFFLEQHDALRFAGLE